MNPSDTLLLLPDKWRLACYAAFAVLGAVLVATQVGYAAADIGQPIWLTVAWPVYGSLGTSFGLLAGTNVTPRQA
jgi:quinol-cytochrome oxidoreductase complex cytochrome b subunit